MSYGKELSLKAIVCQTDKQNPSALQINGQKFTQMLVLASQHWNLVLTARLSIFMVCIH